MGSLALGTVDGGEVAQAIVVALASGIGVTIAFSVLVYGYARLQASRRAGLPVRVLLFGALMAVGAAGTIAAIGLALYVILEQDS